MTITDNEHTTRRHRFLRDDYGNLREGPAFVAVMGVVVALIGVITAVAIVISTVVNYHFAVQNCRHWSEAIGRPAHEVRYSFGAWDCLTPNPARPGTYIPNSRLFLVNK